MRVQLPDGRVIDGIPEGTTKRELVRRLRRGGAIDNATAAEMLGIQIEDQPASAGMSTTERFTVGAGRGAVDIAEGLGQIVREGMDVIDPRTQPPTPDPANPDAPPIPGVVTPGRADLFNERAMEERRLFDEGGLGTAGTAGRIIGNIAAGGAIARPVAAASGLATLERGGRVARALANTAGGVAGGGAAFVEEGGSRAQNMVLGGALGLALAPVAGAIANRLGRIARSGTRRITRPRRLRAAMAELANDTQLSGDQKRRIANDIADGFTPEQAMRKFEIEEIGAIPTRGRVTGDLDDLRFEVDQRRVSGPVAETEQASRRGVDARMRAEVERLSRGADVDPGSAGDVASQALERGRAAMKDLERQAFQAVDERLAQLPDNVRIGARSLRAAVGDEIDFLDAEALAPVRSRLRRLGVLDAGGELADEVVLTPTQAESARRVLGEVFRSGDPNAKRVAGKLREALQEDVVRDVGEDVFVSARAISAERFAAFDNREKVSAILQGKIGPEQVVKRIQGAGTKASEVHELFETLDAVDSNAANLLRASVLEDVFSKARGAVDADGVPSLTPASLQRKVKALGMAKMEAMFGRPQAEALAQFSDRLSKFAAIDFRTAGPGTAGDLMNKLRASFGRLLGATPGGRWVSGAYEAIRNGVKSREGQTMARRALNLEILKRENLMAELLEPRAHPATAAAAGATAAEERAVSSRREGTAR